MIRIALGQMLVEPGRKSANIHRARKMVREAAAQGAQIIVLPEALNAGWTYPDTAKLADPIPTGETCAALIEEAKRHHIYVCAGLAERAGNKVYNAAVLLDPEGRLILHHRKIHELEIA